MKNKRLKKVLISIIIGAILGFFYYRFFGCDSGCAITSNPLISTVYGAVAGFFIAFF